MSDSYPRLLIVGKARKGFFTQREKPEGLSFDRLVGKY
jgi:hypothetical protein